MKPWCFARGTPFTASFGRAKPRRRGSQLQPGAPEEEEGGDLLFLGAFEREHLGSPSSLPLSPGRMQGSTEKAASQGAGSEAQQLKPLCGSRGSTAAPSRQRLLCHFPQLVQVWGGLQMRLGGPKGVRPC